MKIRRIMLALLFAVPFGTASAYAQGTEAQPAFNLFSFLGPQCDQTLWTHVYHPSRLNQQGCITVTGTIVDATHGRRRDGVRHEADGDTHGWLKPDPQYAHLLDEGNKRYEGGNLVFEIVCHWKPTQADAKPACSGYHSTIAIPPVGTHVMMTGTYVLDTNHGRWMEIHPVSSITTD